MEHVSMSALYAALDVQRATRGLSWRDVGRETGLPNATFSRIRSGDVGINLDNYITCCHWLGVPLATFTSLRVVGTPNLTADLVTLLRRHRVPEVYWRPLAGLIGHLAAEANRHPGPG